MVEKSFRVVAAVIRDKDRYLITQRRTNATMPLLWEFPGGRVEAGESDRDALMREFGERLGGVLTVGRPVAFRRHDYEGYGVELVLYEAQLDSGGLEPLRVKDYRWVEAGELGEYPFPPADQQTLDDFQLLVRSQKPKKPPQA